MKRLIKPKALPPVKELWKALLDTPFERSPRTLHGWRKGEAEPPLGAVILLASKLDGWSVEKLVVSLVATKKEPK